jgi:hypothetical protein
MMIYGVPHLRILIDVCPPQGPGFDNVRFVMNKVAWGNFSPIISVFPYEISFDLYSVFEQM